MIILTKEQILLMHDQLIEETGGSKGLKDEGMLESALAAPFQSFDGKVLFPSVYQKAVKHPAQNEHNGRGLFAGLINHIKKLAAYKVERECGKFTGFTMA